MSTTLISIHGRGKKPGPETLANLWREALVHGFQRFEKDRLDALISIAQQFVYYGDLTTRYLLDRGETYDEALDVADRESTLLQLQKRKRKTFYSRTVYERLPGRSAVGEMIADLGLPLMRSFGFSEKLLARVVPDYLGYWDEATGIRAVAVKRLIDALRVPMTRGDNVVLLSHCLGSVIAYDALWQLAYDGAADWYDGQKVVLWMTIGSPLGDETVKKRLAGADRSDQTRYPDNVVHWMNVTAEDDYISHDDTVANDFKQMLRNRQVSSIEDQKILNLAVRYGRSNPHSAIGYLVHPLVIAPLAEALSRRT